MYNERFKVNFSMGNINAKIESLPKQTKTITPSIAQSEVEADSGFDLEKVVVEPVTSNIDANIVANNIAKGVTILGVTGTYTDAINGVNFDSSELTIANEILGAQGIVISGQLEQTEINITEYVDGTILIVNGQEIDVNNASVAIEGVTYADSELIVDQSLLKAHDIIINNTNTMADVNVQGDTTNVYLELVDGTIDLSNCESEVYIEDSFTKDHVVQATNLTPENIKGGVTILGVLGTYSDAIEGVTWDESTYTLDINKNGYININQSAEVLINGGVKVEVGTGSINATNLTAENIKKGVTILGVTGTYEGE